MSYLGHLCLATITGLAPNHKPRCNNPCNNRISHFANCDSSCASLLFPVSSGPSSEPSRKQGHTASSSFLHKTQSEVVKIWTSSRYLVFIRTCYMLASQARTERSARRPAHQHKMSKNDMAQVREDNIFESIATRKNTNLTTNRQVSDCT